MTTCSKWASAPPLPPITSPITADQHPPPSGGGQRERGRSSSSFSVRVWGGGECQGEAWDGVEWVTRFLSQSEAGTSSAPNTQKADRGIHERKGRGVERS